MAENSQSFRTTLFAAGGNNVGIVVPDEVVAAFGRGKRVPVLVTIDGDHQYRTTITSAKSADTRARRVAKGVAALQP